MKPLLLLSTIHRTHASHSGYQVLADHLPEAKYLTAPRVEPPGGWRLLAARVARRAAFTRWYVGGSAELELKARRELRAGFAGIIHFLWADHDLGFLDHFMDLGTGRHRLVGSFHNCDDTFIHTIRFPRRLRRFSALILMSRTQIPFFLNAGVPRDRLHVVLHGVDTTYYRPAPASAPDQPFTVLSAGGYRRDFAQLRQVCLHLKDEPGLCFDVIAPESFRPFIADLPNARFRTGLGNDDFLHAYQTSSCLLQTVENATANNVLLEAMACGQPIVAESVGGIPEYVSGSCALLAPKGDTAALAAAILSLKNSPSLRASMSRAARAHAETLDWEQTAIRMRAIYAQL